MKSIIIVLLLASVAWGGNCTMIESEKGFAYVCSRDFPDEEVTILYPSCSTSCADWTVLDEITCKCIVKKGHCPYCGAKAIEDTHGLQVIKGNEVLWTIRRCPAGHLFWEKD